LFLLVVSFDAAAGGFFTAATACFFAAAAAAVLFRMVILLSGLKCWYVVLGGVAIGHGFEPLSDLEPFSAKNNLYICMYLFIKVSSVKDIEMGQLTFLDIILFIQIKNINIKMIHDQG
jgi:hypothetical protein